MMLVVPERTIGKIVGDAGDAEVRFNAELLTEEALVAKATMAHRCPIWGRRSQQTSASHALAR